MTKRVVVTGMALTSPLGSNIDACFESLLKLENCVEYNKDLDQYQ